MCETDFNKKNVWGAEGGSGFLKENIFDSEITYYIMTCIIVIFLPNLCFVFVFGLVFMNILVCLPGLELLKGKQLWGFFNFRIERNIIYA